MRRKNDVLDKINNLQEEVDRLYARIPEDTDERFDFWLRIIRGIRSLLVGIENLVELEDEDYVGETNKWNGLTISTFGWEYPLY